MDESSTTPNEDNLDTAPQGTDNGPAPTEGDNPDPSKSTDDTSADGDTTASDEDTSADDDAPASQFDDDLDDWIAKRGLKAETEAEKQALQDLRNDQRAFTRTQQQKKEADAAAELNKGVDDLAKEVKPEQDEDEDDDEYEKRLKAVEADRDAERTTRLQSEFYTENRVSESEHKAILEIIKEKVASKASQEDKIAALDFWGNPMALPDLLDIAKARLSKGDTEAAAEAAAKAERERIAKESHSNSASRNAKNPTSGDKTLEEERLERFSSDW